MRTKGSPPARTKVRGPVYLTIEGNELVAVIKVQSCGDGEQAFGSIELGRVIIDDLRRADKVVRFGPVEIEATIIAAFHNTEIS